MNKLTYSLISRYQVTREENAKETQFWRGMVRRNDLSSPTYSFISIIYLWKKEKLPKFIWFSLPVQLLWFSMLSNPGMVKGGGRTERLFLLQFLALKEVEIWTLYLKMFHLLKGQQRVSTPVNCITFTFSIQAKKCLFWHLINKIKPILKIRKRDPMKNRVMWEFVLNRSPWSEMGPIEKPCHLQICVKLGKTRFRPQCVTWNPLTISRILKFKVRKHWNFSWIQLFCERPSLFKHNWKQ